MRISAAKCWVTIALLSLGIFVCTITDDTGNIIDPGNPLQPGTPVVLKEKPALIASPDSAYVRLGDTLAIRVRVMRDSAVTDSSRGLAGARIAVANSAGWVSADTLVADANGRAVLLFTDSTTRENVQIRLSCYTASLIVRFDVTDAPVRIQKLIEAMPEKPIVKADGRDFTLINVRVMNKDHNPLVGESIQFITTAGLISGVDPGTSRNPGQSVTNEEGIASAKLLSTNVNDTAFVTVFLVSNRLLSDETQVAFQGVTIAVKTDSSNLRTGGKTMLTAQVLNASNVPVARARVYFSFSKGNSSNLEFDPVMLDTVTGFDGMARAIIVGKSAGTDSVVVSAAGAMAKICINVSNLTLRTTVYPRTLQASKDTATLEILFANIGGTALGGRAVRVTKHYQKKDGGNVTDTLEGKTDSDGTCRFSIPALAYDGLIRIETTAFNTSTEIATAVNTVECITTRVITMDAFPSSIMADGTDRSAITVQVKNENNNPIIGDEISFVTNAGVIAATSVTDSGGRAVAYLVSERRNAVATVTATLVKDRNKKDSIQVEFSGISLDFSANPRSINTYGTDSSILRVSVLDAMGKPIAGEKVYFSHRKDTVYKTDTRGVAVSTIRGSGSAASRDTIFASAAGAADTVVIKYSNNRIVITDTVPRPHIANGRDSTRIFVRYQAENGQPITNTLLKVSVTMGLVSLPADTTRGIPADTVFFDVRRTNENGYIDFAVLNPLFPDSATVSVIANDPTETEGSRRFFFASDRIDRIMIEGTPAVIGIAPARATITATAFDAQGNRVSNALIAFNMLRGPGGGTRLEPASRTTGPDGTARIELIAGTIPSAYSSVWVVAGDSSRIKSDTAKFTIAGPPASITVRSNVLKGINPNDGTFRLPCAAVVSDINGNPVADGTPVTFTVKVSGYIVYALAPDCNDNYADEVWWCGCTVKRDTSFLPFEDLNDNHTLDIGENQDGNAIASRGEDVNGDGKYITGPKYFDINRNGRRDYDWDTPVEGRGKNNCEDNWADEMWPNSLWDVIEPLDDPQYMRIYTYMRANGAFERLLRNKTMFEVPHTRYSAAITDLSREDSVLMRALNSLVADSVALQQQRTLLPAELARVINAMDSLKRAQGYIGYRLAVTRNLDTLIDTQMVTIDSQRVIVRKQRDNIYPQRTTIHTVQNAILPIRTTVEQQRSTVEIQRSVAVTALSDSTNKLTSLINLMTTLTGAAYTAARSDSIRLTADTSALRRTSDSLLSVRDSLFSVSDSLRGITDSLQVLSDSLLDVSDSLMLVGDFLTRSYDSLSHISTVVIPQRFDSLNMALDQAVKLETGSRQDSLNLENEWGNLPQVITSNSQAIAAKRGEYSQFTTRAQLLNNLVKNDDQLHKDTLDSLDGEYEKGEGFDPVFGYDYDVNHNGAPDPNTSVNVKRTIQTVNGKAINEVQYGQSDANIIEVMIWAESQGVRTLSPEKIVLPIIGE